MELVVSGPCTVRVFVVFFLVVFLVCLCVCLLCVSVCRSVWTTQRRRVQVGAVSCVWGVSVPGAAAHRCVRVSVQAWKLVIDRL